LPNLPKLTSAESESLLFKAGFELIRSKGSHRIYIKNGIRVVIPFHSGKILHPKIIKELFEALDSAK